jgi:hypothetical protein
MSNQQKAEFVNDIFRIQSFWGDHGEILPKISPELRIQQPIKFLSVVTRKSLTVWILLIDQRKAERVFYQNDIWDFRSFGQSEA